MNRTHREEVFAQLGESWLACLRPEVEKFVYSSWVGDGVAVGKEWKEYSAIGKLLQRPARKFGQRTEQDLKDRDVGFLTSRSLGNLRRQAISDGEDPPPNWFSMTLRRDGNHEFTLTYDAEQERIREEERAAGRRERQEYEAQQEREERERRIQHDLRVAADLIDDQRSLAQTNFDNIWNQPDEPRWMERFFISHASIGLIRAWQSVHVGMKSENDGSSTSIFQHVQWEGEDMFEALPMDDPQLVIDALEHLRVQQGEVGSQRRDLTVRLTPESMELVWGAERS